jgi:hypothetical protein
VATDEGRGTTMADLRRWKTEVQEYLEKHPSATTSDVAMCLNMSKESARRIIGKI